MATPSVVDPAKLRAAVRGNVTLPEDDVYDTARQAWRLAVDQIVPAVVEPADAEDVAATVRYAVAEGLAVAPQTDGHGATGTATGALLLRTTALTEVSVDPAARTARVGAGVTWGKALAATGRHHLTGLAGSAPTPGVVGYTLGGGVGWFSRAHGLASDAVRSFDVVLADGTATNVDASTDPDLFRALRGGGGEFAVVTAVEFDLFPAHDLYGGRMVFPGALSADLLEVYREVTASAPDTVSVWYTEVRPPDSDPIVTIDSAIVGEGPGPHGVLAPFEALGPVADSRGPLNPADLGTIADEPTGPSAGLNRTELLTEFDDQAAAAVAAGPPSPLFAVQIRHLGGALARPRDIPGVVGPVAAEYAVSVLGIGASPESSAAVEAAQVTYLDQFSAFVEPVKPLNTVSATESVNRAFSVDTLAWLRQLKDKRDPHAVVRGNMPVHG